MTVDLCRHIKTNGLQCHGAALSASVFCYFHNRLHRSHDLYRDKVHFQSSQMMDRPFFLQLPAIEDRESAQLAISCVINALATGCITPKLANALFYGLQLASANACGLRIVRRPTQVVRDVYKEPWVTIPDANPDIAPARPHLRDRRHARTNQRRTNRRSCHPELTHRTPNGKSCHPERSEGPPYFAPSPRTAKAHPTCSPAHPLPIRRRIKRRLCMDPQNLASAPIIGDPRALPRPIHIFQASSIFIDSKDRSEQPSNRNQLPGQTHHA